MYKRTLEHANQNALNAKKSDKTYEYGKIYSSVSLAYSYHDYRRRITETGALYSFRRLRLERGL